MTKTKLNYRNLVDYIPLAILYAYAFILLAKIFTSDVIISWRHLSGAIVLGFTTFVFFKNHKIGVLSLGVTLLLGAISVISFNSPISITTYSIGKSEDSLIPVFYGQPVFLLWLLLHFVCSIRHYIGIGTKEYWRNIKAVKSA